MRTRRISDGQGGVIAAIVVASLLINLLALTAPIYMIQLFTRVITSGSLSTLAALTVGAAIALGFHFAIDALRQRLVVRLGNRIEAGLGPSVLGGLMRRASGFEETDASPLRDLQEVRSFVTSPYFTAILDAPWSLLFLVVIYLFHPLLGVVATVGLATLAALGAASELLSRRPSADAALAQNAANRTVAEMVQNSDVILAMGGRTAQTFRWERLNAAGMVLGTVANDRVTTLGSLARLVRIGLQIAILATGVMLVLDGQLSAGVMIATSILLGRAAAPVEQSIAGWRAIVSARAAKARIEEVLADLDDRDRRMPLPEPEGRLSVDGATILPAGRDRPLIFDVSFDLEPGQSLGIVGPSGAGKTSLARALVGLHPLTRGTIRVDGAALTDWPVEQIGRTIGFLPQRTDLMVGTVGQNIALMEEGADPAAIVAAAKLAGVHELILALPGGYNCPVGPRGESLSAGQRQRIGLARAFYGGRRIVVLDEPNANLDPAGEEALAKAVAAATAAGRVVIVITHRTSILRRVSHVAVMQDGQVTRFGPAAEILRTAVRPVAAETTDDVPIRVAPHAPRGPRVVDAGLEREVS